MFAMHACTESDNTLGLLGASPVEDPRQAPGNFLIKQITGSKASNSRWAEYSAKSPHRLITSILPIQGVFVAWMYAQKSKHMSVNMKAVG